MTLKEIFKRSEVRTAWTSSTGSSKLICFHKKKLKYLEKFAIKTYSSEIMISLYNNKISFINLHLRQNIHFKSNIYFLIFWTKWMKPNKNQSFNKLLNISHQKSYFLIKYLCFIVPMSSILHKVSLFVIYIISYINFFSFSIFHGKIQT